MQTLASINEIGDLSNLLKLEGFGRVKIKNNDSELSASSVVPSILFLVTVCLLSDAFLFFMLLREGFSTWIVVIVLIGFLLAEIAACFIIRVNLMKVNVFLL